MKFLTWLAFFPALALAQTVDVNKVDTDTDTTTTIQIQKSKNTPQQQAQQPMLGQPQLPKWEVHDGNADVEGETTATRREAKDAWTKACNEWKKEIHQDNKNVLALNCGKAECSGEAGSFSCTSKGNYKVNIRTDQ